MRDVDILIIGNGFDLWCQLKSKYSDFAESRRNKFKSFYEALDLLLDKSRPGKLTYKFIKDNIDHVLNTYNSELNFWEIYFEITNFKKVDDILWLNIEQDILSFFQPVMSDKFSKLYRLIARIEKLEHFPSTEIDRDIFHSYIQYSILLKQRDLTYTSENYDIKVSMDILASVFERKGKDKLGRYLLNELNRFESAFGMFLRSQIIINSKYDENATKLVSLITKDLGNMSNVNTPRDLYYLNFNYTLPKVKQLAKGGTNVHGYVGEENECGEIVIGIDQEQIDENTDAYAFTKTYRKLFLKQKLKSQPLPHKKFVRRIIFYGHSYGKADYSYFRSIFDYYDIESSNVQLIFYYSVYKKNIEDEISHGQYKDISSLLIDYSRNANKLAGKNLLHRLLLEHRLTIQKVGNLDDRS